MIIRKEQFSQYLQDDENQFISFICKHLREEHPETLEPVAGDVLQQMVTNGMARARRYGFKTDQNLMAFVAVMAEIAPNFDEHPALHEVLTDSTIPVNSRLDALFHPVLGRAWEQAKKESDQKAWFRESTSKLISQ